METRIIISHIVGAWLGHFGWVGWRPGIDFYGRARVSSGFCGFGLGWSLNIGFGVFLRERFVVIWEIDAGFERWDVD
jgi:hypothetical protein